MPITDSSLVVRMKEEEAAEDDVMKGRIISNHTQGNVSPSSSRRFIDVNIPSNTPQTEILTENHTFLRLQPNKQSNSGEAGNVRTSVLSSLKGQALTLSQARCFVAIDDMLAYATPQKIRLASLAYKTSVSCSFRRCKVCSICFLDMNRVLVCDEAGFLALCRLTAEFDYVCGLKFEASLPEKVIKCASHDDAFLTVHKEAAYIWDVKTLMNVALSAKKLLKVDAKCLAEKSTCIPFNMTRFPAPAGREAPKFTDIAIGHGLIDIVVAVNNSTLKLWSSKYGNPGVRGGYEFLGEYCMRDNTQSTLDVCWIDIISAGRGYYNQLLILGTQNNLECRLYYFYHLQKSVNTGKRLTCLQVISLYPTAHSITSPPAPQEGFSLDIIQAFPPPPIPPSSTSENPSLLPISSSSTANGGDPLVALSGSKLTGTTPTPSEGRTSSLMGTTTSSPPPYPQNLPPYALSSRDIMFPAEVRPQFFLDAKLPVVYWTFMVAEKPLPSKNPSPPTTSTDETVFSRSPENSPRSSSINTVLGVMVVSWPKEAAGSRSVAASTLEEKGRSYPSSWLPVTQIALFQLQGSILDIYPFISMLKAPTLYCVRMCANPDWKKPDLLASSQSEGIMEGGGEMKSNSSTPTSTPPDSIEGQKVVAGLLLDSMALNDNLIDLRMLNAVVNGNKVGGWWGEEVWISPPRRSSRSLSGGNSASSDQVGGVGGLHGASGGNSSASIASVFKTNTTVFTTPVSTVTNVLSIKSVSTRKEEVVSSAPQLVGGEIVGPTVKLEKDCGVSSSDGSDKKMVSCDSMGGVGGVGGIGSGDGSEVSAGGATNAPNTSGATNTPLVSTLSIPHSNAAHQRPAPSSSPPIESRISSDKSTLLAALRISPVVGGNIAATCAAEKHNVTPQMGGMLKSTSLQPTQKQQPNASLFPSSYRDAGGSGRPPASWGSFNTDANLSKVSSSFSSSALLSSSLASSSSSSSPPASSSSPPASSSSASSAPPPPVSPELTAAVSSQHHLQHTPKMSSPLAAPHTTSSGKASSPDSSKLLSMFERNHVRTSYTNQLDPFNRLGGGVVGGVVEVGKKPLGGGGEGATGENLVKGGPKVNVGGSVEETGGVYTPAESLPPKGEDEPMPRTHELLKFSASSDSSKVAGREKLETSSKPEASSLQSTIKGSVKKSTVKASVKAPADSADEGEAHSPPASSSVLDPWEGMIKTLSETSKKMELMLQNVEDHGYGIDEKFAKLMILIFEMKKAMTPDVLKGFVDNATQSAVFEGFKTLQDDIKSYSKEAAATLMASKSREASTQAAKEAEALCVSLQATLQTTIKEAMPAIIAREISAQFEKSLIPALIESMESVFSYSKLQCDIMQSLQSITPMNQKIISMVERMDSRLSKLESRLDSNSAASLKRIDLVKASITESHEKLKTSFDGLLAFISSRDFTPRNTSCEAEDSTGLPDERGIDEVINSLKAEDKSLDALQFALTMRFQDDLSHTQLRSICIGIPISTLPPKFDEWGAAVLVALCRELVLGFESQHDEAPNKDVSKAVQWVASAFPLIVQNISRLHPSESFLSQMSNAIKIIDRKVKELSEQFDKYDGPLYKQLKSEDVPFVRTFIQIMGDYCTMLLIKLEG